jgi:trimeric autotransporter adhesin
MNASVILSEISSLPEIKNATKATPAAGRGSFEDHLSAALNADEPDSDSKLSRRNSKEPTGNSTLEPVHIPTLYANLTPGARNLLNDAVTSTLSRLPSLLGNAEQKTGASSGPLPKVVSPDDREMTSAANVSDFAANQPSVMGSPGQSAEKSSSAVSSSKFLGGAHSVQDSPEVTFAGNASHFAANYPSATGSPGQSAEKSSSAVSSSRSSGGAHTVQNVTQKTASSTEVLAQEEEQMERALASLEDTSLSAPSLVASPARTSTMNAAPAKIAAVPSATGRSQTADVSSSIKSVSERPSEQSPSQTLGKGAQSSNGNGPDAPSASGGSPAPAKVASGTAGDDSKNPSSQENSSKPPSPSSPQTTSTGNASGNNATTTSLAAQVANSGFPQALSQAAQTTNSGAHSGGSPAATASQPGAPDKIATAMENAVDTAGGVINSASLVQSQGKTEMHVAMQTDTLGALQLHAVLDNGQLGASIQVVSHDAHTVLTNDLPALQQVLKEQNLRIDHLAVINSPMTSGAGARDGRSFQSEDFNQSGNQNSRWLSNSPALAMPNSSAEALPLEDRVGRLSVRA